MKTKTQISCAVTVQLISAFVFATRIVGNPEDRFSQRGSYYVNKLLRYGYVMFFKFLLLSFQIKNNDDNYVVLTEIRSAKVFSEEKLTYPLRFARAGPLNMGQN